MEKFVFKFEKPTDDPNYMKKVVCLHIMLENLYRLKLQEERIREDQKELKNSNNIKNLKKVFADIHFFLVSISNLEKVFIKLKKLYSSDTNFVNIYKKYVNKINYLDKFRDHIEHITDNRIDGKDGKGKPLKQPSELGNLWGDDYSFGGDKFNLQEAFDLADSLSLDIKNWNKKYPFLSI